MPLFFLSAGFDCLFFASKGQRVSTWNGSTKAQIRGQYYWGMKPVAYYDTTSTHFQHQDWLGAERLRTTYNGAVEATLTSLPFGDGQTTESNGDPYYFASLDYDAETATDHAQFRQYASTQGRWMSPDPYGGSYDMSNPQSMDRYVYALNSPLGFIDPRGLDEYFFQDGCLMYSFTVTYSVEGEYYFDVYQTVIGCGPGYGSVPSADGPGSQGNGGGVSSTTPAPDQKPTSPAQQCVDSFNNSTAGKVTNFFSPLSPFIGPDPLESGVEDFGGGALKFAGFKVLRYQQTTNFLQYFAEGAADLMHFSAAELLPPVAAGAAALQLGVHLGCGTLPNNSSATLGETFSDDSNPEDYGVTN